jgi:hypothetical protein
MQAEGQVRDDARRAGVLAGAPGFVPEFGYLGAQTAPHILVPRGEPADKPGQGSRVQPFRRIFLAGGQPWVRIGRLWSQIPR